MHPVPGPGYLSWDLSIQTRLAIHVLAGLAHGPGWERWPAAPTPQAAMLSCPHQATNQGESVGKTSKGEGAGVAPSSGLDGGLGV